METHVVEIEEIFRNENGATRIVGTDQASGRRWNNYRIWDNQELNTAQLKVNSLATFGVQVIPRDEGGFFRNVKSIQNVIVSGLESVENSSEPQPSAIKQQGTNAYPAQKTPVQMRQEQESTQRTSIENQVALKAVVEIFVETLRHRQGISFEDIVMDEWALIAQRASFLSKCLGSLRTLEEKNDDNNQVSVF